ncbi:MAG: hypothetical protein NTW49_03720 [Bacteroidia bacterium]|nr:hypothetical protein [Bacteroidia bacterium]
MKNVIRLMISLAPAMICSLLIVVSCKHDSVDIAKFPKICFVKQVLPIFTSNCTMSGCHGDTDDRRLKLTTYQGIMKGVVPGKPDNSSVYTAITSVWGNRMPPNRPLPQELRTLIRLWILQGADTICTNDTTTHSITAISTYGGMVSHNVGQNCQICHVTGGPSNAWFTVAGTVYDSTKIKPYPNATVKLYTGLKGQGNLVATIPVDGKGNFYTTAAINYGSGLYPLVIGTKNDSVFMPQLNTLGSCNSCHDSIENPRIWISSNSVVVHNDSICFKEQVLPVLTSNCAMSGCHDNATHASGYIFLDYSSTMATLTVIPHDPLNSLLYKVIIATSNVGPDQMPPPPRTSLIQSQIAIISQWISEGALNRDCSSQPCDLSNVTFSGVVWPVIQNNCTGCHSGATPSGSVSLTNYTDVKTVAVSGKLVGTITHQSPEPLMPPTNALTQCQINQITLWVNNGGNNNK